MEEILYQEPFTGSNKVAPSSAVFKIIGDRQDIIDRLTAMIGIDPDDEEDGAFHCSKEYDQNFTQEERLEDEKKITSLITLLKLEETFATWFKRLVRKKNGTLYNARVLPIARFSTFQHIWEDSYGYAGPEVVIRSLDDFTARLEMITSVEKW